MIEPIPRFEQQYIKQNTDINYQYYLKMSHLACSIPVLPFLPEFHFSSLSDSKTVGDTLQLAELLVCGFFFLLFKGHLDWMMCKM
jgi:hypothetical protein